MKRPTLSITVCVLNEELLLGEVLASISGVADEIIVVDTGSTDDTLEIARKAGARVIIHNEPNHLKAWNVALQAARCDWVLNLDGDEVVAQSDHGLLRELIKQSEPPAYYLRTRNYSTIMDLAYKWFPADGSYADIEKRSGCAGYWLSFPLRLFRRDPGVHFRVGATNHTRPDASIEALGWKVARSDVTLHNLGVVKGGDRYLARKNAARLQGELEYRDREAGDDVNLARTYFFHGDDQKALEYLDAALKKSPRMVDALYFRGLVLKERGDFEAAQRALNEVLEIDNEHSDAWMVMGMVKQLMGLPLEARDALRRSLAVHPTHPLAHNSLAIVHEDLGNWADAEASYLRALELHPGLPCGYDNLAAFYRERGRDDEAGILSEKAAGLDRLRNL